MYLAEPETYRSPTPAPAQGGLILVRPPLRVVARPAGLGQLGQFNLSQMVGGLSLQTAGLVGAAALLGYYFFFGAAGRKRKAKAAALGEAKRKYTAEVARIKSEYKARRTERSRWCWPASRSADRRCNCCSARGCCAG